MMKEKDSHQHEEDECCDATKKISIISTKKHERHDHEEEDHEGGDESLLKSRWALWLSLSILLGFILLSSVFKIAVPKTVEIVLMGIAYVLAGYKTVQKAFSKVMKGDFFNEFTLMTTATLGAFYIGEYSKGVAVMIFYELGELFQDLAVNRSNSLMKPTEIYYPREKWKKCKPSKRQENIWLLWVTV
jgi:Cd2+/Zn2+-exporting ATPase